MNSKKKRMILEQRLYGIEQGKIEKPDVYGIRKKLIKQNQETNDQDEFGDEIELESDAINTAEYLIKLNSNNFNIPICFSHQIYSILPNHTIIDRELQQAINEGKWRKFHMIGALDDEYILLKTLNYCEIIENLKIEQENDLQAIDLFHDIINEYREIQITKKVLISKTLTDENIKKLISIGLLLPHIEINDLYWFSIPNQGRFINNVIKGRIEILRMLKKRNTKEILEKLLKQKKLQKTVLHIEFLLHDLIGSGRVERYKTAMGDIIRLTNKGEQGI